MRRANYIVTKQTTTALVIQDVGPWDTNPTVTNAAERVVEELAPHLHGRRLEYIDSDGNQDEIVVKDGKFVGFRALPK